MRHSSNKLAHHCHLLLLTFPEGFHKIAQLLSAFFERIQNFTKLLPLFVFLFFHVQTTSFSGFLFFFPHTFPLFFSECLVSGVGLVIELAGHCTSLTVATVCRPCFAHVIQSYNVPAPQDRMDLVIKDGFSFATHSLLAVPLLGFLVFVDQVLDFFLALLQSFVGPNASGQKTLQLRFFHKFF